MNETRKKLLIRAIEKSPLMVGLAMLFVGLALWEGVMYVLYDMGREVRVAIEPYPQGRLRSVSAWG